MERSRPRNPSDRRLDASIGEGLLRGAETPGRVRGHEGRQRLLDRQSQGLAHHQIIAVNIRTD